MAANPKPERRRVRCVINGREIDVWEGYRLWDAALDADARLWKWCGGEGPLRHVRRRPAVRGENLTPPTKLEKFSLALWFAKPLALVRNRWKGRPVRLACQSYVRGPVEVVGVLGNAGKSRARSARDRVAPPPRARVYREATRSAAPPPSPAPARSSTSASRTWRRAALARRLISPDGTRAGAGTARGPPRRARIERDRRRQPAAPRQRAPSRRALGDLRVARASPKSGRPSSFSTARAATPASGSPTRCARSGSATTFCCRTCADTAAAAARSSRSGSSRRRTSR